MAVLCRLESVYRNKTFPARLIEYIPNRFQNSTLTWQPLILTKHGCITVR